ncbi:probable cytochrome P450 6d5 [Contarinia nasturtii]|uniref:probable cytochrome P450 6d5 n=1 Tax=Contarinia nasturtii TaxID=265458 RepID=UPI0012D4268B|nr:probable cytochrome P450 6d5 [Contarinia nasturtii]
MAFLTDSWKIDVLAFLVGALTVLYFFIKQKYSYWERKGIKTPSCYNYFVGHITELFMGKESFADFSTRMYKSSQEPFIGIYTVLQPILLVRDPELIRTIFIKDFPHFTDRGVHSNEGYDPLSGNLFSLSGKRWKEMRAKFSPTFTSGKLKAMFSTFIDCGSILENYLEKLATNGEILDVSEISASHSTNIIASVAFGIDIDCIKNPDCEFRVCGRQMFETSFWNNLRFAMFFIAPKLMSLLRIKIASENVERFLLSMVKQNLEYREKNNVSRKDFFQLLIQLRNSGTVQLDGDWDTVIMADHKQKTLTLNEMTAQCFVYFGAGFETSSTTLSFCIYELVKNPEIQKRVHEEIDRVIEQHEGLITYDSLADMKYLEACIDETLRKYPPLSFLTRECVKEYKLPGTDKVIEKGTQLFIPAFALQRDEKYYEEPDKFIPERFSEENLSGKDLTNRPYYPFGEGPRNCIGRKMGKLQVKVGLVSMLKKFHFELEDRLKKNEIKFDPKVFVISPLGGIKLHIKKR